jgi:carboxylesterase
MIIILLLILLVPLVYLWGRPLNVDGLAAAEHPALTYAEAVARVKRLDAPAADRLSRYGHTVLMTHGHKTRIVVVFLHGYTKAPHEFEPLGKLLFDHGANVLIPRLPHHGLEDRMTTEQAMLTAEEMAVFADEIVNCADELGEHIVMVGLSAGGLTAAWAAQHRGEIDKAIILAPAFGYKDVPTPLTRPAMNAYLTLPNSFKWWDEVKKEQIVPDFYYPRYSTRSLAELLRLSFATQQRAAEHPPAAQSILVVTNANDKSVNNALTAQVVADWRRQASSKIETFEFPESQGLDHDFIDPDMPHQQTQTVYPILVDLILRSPSKTSGSR